jgi:hypothetical protein
MKIFLPSEPDVVTITPSLRMPAATAPQLPRTPENILQGATTLQGEPNTTPHDILPMTTPQNRPLTTTPQDRYPAEMPPSCMKTPQNMPPATNLEDESPEVSQSQAQDTLQKVATPHCVTTSPAQGVPPASTPQETPPTTAVAPDDSTKVVTFQVMIDFLIIMLSCNWNEIP